MADFCALINMVSERFVTFVAIKNHNQLFKI